MGPLRFAPAVLWLTTSLANGEAPRLAEPWRTGYEGDSAVGEHVLGFWQFTAGAEIADSSGRGHPCEILGASTNPDGRFGSCLESFRGWPDEDTRHAAVVPNHPELSPAGAFSLELWVSPKPELEGYPESFLVDKRYVADTDYQLILGAADRQGLRRLRMVLGFGDGSETYASEPMAFPAGTWSHIAFVYDGRGGGWFVVDGLSRGGGNLAGRGSIRPGAHSLSIGDRIGSYYHGFPGLIDEVRLCQGALEFRRGGLSLATERRAYRRMEGGRRLRLEVTNYESAPLVGARLRLSIGGTGAVEIALPELPPGSIHAVEYPLDTSLRPGEYALGAALAVPDEPAPVSEEAFAIWIAARPVPETMPVLMWGVGPGALASEIPRLRAIGFTHALGPSADFGRIWDAGQPCPSDSPERLAETRRMLDTALVSGIGVCAPLSPGSWVGSGKSGFRRVDREGKATEEPELCALFPELGAFCRSVGASVAADFGDYPALDCALLHTEVRDGADLCFHDHDRAAYRQATGLEIPDAVTHKGGVTYAKLPGFPADRVVADDDPIYRFLQWYWKTGDGWNGLNTALAEGLKSAGRQDLWTFHDPAVRVASVLGSGGDVDVVSQWTYSYPDPLRIATATDELLAMARHAGSEQDVMKMTQIIWYRSQTAPAGPAGTGPRSVWEDTEPGADFITIAPMHLREAFWTKIARPAKGIMYHGWESLVPTTSTGAYRYTHPDTQAELARLTHEIVQPLGPALRQVPEPAADVAVLESFASQMFAGRGTYGWGGSWLGDVYLILQWAQLQTEIVYDETILQGALDGRKVLVMVDCDVLTRSVVDHVKVFQEAGGLIVGDDRLCPAITPDIVLTPYTRAGQADTDKAALQAIAAKLRAELDGRYTRFADSSSPDVVTHTRRFGTTDYIFLINDRREFGDYVGQHKLVMERGLPSDATVTLRRTGTVYDLVAHREVAAAARDGALTIDAHVEPCDGRLFMVVDRPIAGLTIAAPDRVGRGATASLSVTVADAAGQPIDAVVPVRLDILDPDGRPAEFSGYYGAKDGRLEVACDLAPNDTPGTWEIRATELASGLVARHYMRVE